ncbi:response regulator [Salegentibacter sp. UBA1130]|uniref:response regulator n=1 Tax=Salegentibacter sp. UBA1130 TaxID=1947451 RepID=UPI00257B49FE|nr:response regulator [Salegentibacter sp. UBA1130]
MNKVVKVLMVDDHPLIVEGYKNILQELSSTEYKIIFETANDLKEAYKKVKQSVISEILFDLIFLDINLPEYTEKNLSSGEDLAVYVRKTSPSSKIVFLTMHNENYRLYNLVKNINPEGLLVKSDVGSKDLTNAFQNVISDKIYYSTTVLKLLQKQVTNDFALDQFDRQILYQLSLGIQTKKLPQVIPLSLPAIEKRKRNLKDVFGLDKEGDLILLRRAKQLGFL